MSTAANSVAAMYARGSKLAPSNGTQMWGVTVLVHKLGVHRTTIYAWMHPEHGCGFPRPRRIGLRKVAWRSDEVEAWLANREMAA